ncbi:DUF1439 domain-containing protein [Variovorax dokdonensis]|uniref:DUF1439 domain-containing protein n=1 Tax=Variovorax dokdonensis TaxID=344883 RepID=A0ABT7NEJ7_9BURK|nr:DUF1439 domain-containing protein [Variovorax dokdonensis]MDM0046285.1 DUF1439 domain-containing protein [Variovorax dokdonensis]
MPKHLPKIVPSALHARRQVLRIAAAGTLLPLISTAARAGFNFFLNEYTATREELQAQITRRFPITERYAEIFSVTLLEPRLSLDGASNRATLAAQLSISSPLLQPSTVPGRVAVSSALRWDAASLALRLQDPRAEKVELDGVRGRDAQQLQRVGAAVAEQLLQGYALHTFKPEELRVGNKTYQVQGITIGNDAVQVALK